MSTKKSYNKKIRIEYFQIVEAPKDIVSYNSDRLFDLRSLVERADDIGLVGRTYGYYQEEARLDKYVYDKISGYWFLNFIRLRQTKLPSTAKKDQVAKHFKLLEDEFIGEEVTAVYDPANHMLALQRNRDSLSSTGIEDYLSNLYNSIKNNIYLRPILLSDTNSKINNANIFRKIDIKFANISTSSYIGRKNTSLSRFIDLFSGYSANSARLTISLGHTRNGSLDIENIRDTINAIDDNKGLVSSAELSLRASMIDPIDTIDLFSMKAHDFIEIKLKKLETIDYIILANKIKKKYDEGKEKLLNSLIK